MTKICQSPKTLVLKERCNNRVRSRISKNHSHEEKKHESATKTKKTKKEKEYVFQK